jgi:plasmid maintenance system antidote protein VapI
MVDAAMMLQRWLDGPPRTLQAKLAKRLRASQASVSSWVGRRKRPGLRHAFRIERLTGIKAESWDKVELVVAKGSEGRAA